MKYIIVVVLSALLITHAPHINNSAKETSQQPGQTYASITVSPLQDMTAKPRKTMAVLSPHEILMAKAGIPQKEWAATDYIVRHESSWNPSARNSSTGAYGLCQAYPATKMSSVGRDYKTNPVTQLKWCYQYANNRYGGWWSAFAFWRGNRWW
jgi:hypothetical protein